MYKINFFALKKRIKRIKATRKNNNGIISTLALTKLTASELTGCTLKSNAEKKAIILSSNNSSMKINIRILTKMCKTKRIAAPNVII